MGSVKVPACSQLTWSQRTQPWGSIVPPSLPRDFVEQHYVTLKKANPDFPILIRECSGVQPKLWARYGKWGLLAGKHCRVCSEWWGGGSAVTVRDIGGREQLSARQGGD